MNILMVCLGNICRSPMADGLLRKKIKERQLNATIDSAGTANYHTGEKPDSRMCRTARKFDVNIDDLRARQFTVKDFDNFDLIFAMDANNKANILKLARNESDKQKVKLLLSEIANYEGTDVPDPYYGTEQDFINVYKLLDEATEQIIVNYFK